MRIFYREKVEDWILVQFSNSYIRLMISKTEIQVRLAKEKVVPFLIFFSIMHFIHGLTIRKL